jgi:hypothetical protein
LIQTKCGGFKANAGGSLLGVTRLASFTTMLTSGRIFMLVHCSTQHLRRSHDTKRRDTGDSSWLDLDGDSRIDWNVYRDFIGGCMNDIQNMLILAALMGVGVALLVAVLIAWINLTGDGND